MTRYLKALVAAAMALVAVGVIGAAGAQAAEFHCSVEPCKVTMKPDGTGKTAHHVIVIKKGATSAAITCESLSAEAESAKKTTTNLLLKNLKYSGCSIGGTPGVVIHSSGCDIHIYSNGDLTYTCTPPFFIEFTLGSCVIKIGAQGPLKSISHTNINSKKEITLSTAVKSLKATASGCAAVGLADGEYNESEYSTGNTILFAEGGASLWWE